MSDQSLEEKLAILREGLARCEREAVDLRAAIRDLQEERRRKAVVEMCPLEACREAGHCLKAGPFGTCKLRPPLDELVRKP